MHIAPAPVDATPVTLAALPQGSSAPRQRTLAKPVECSGIGVHSGERVNMRISPAGENSGITFIRTDLFNGARAIAARWDNVIDTRMCTVIGNDHGGKVATIEHLMAALAACGVDNANIEIDGGEVPVMDGSSESFVFLIDVAGTVAQNAPRRTLEILSPVAVSHNGKSAALTPYDAARYSVTIDFDRAPILTQSCDIALSRETFKNDISRARTFGFFEEVDQMQKAGLARGGSLDNAIVIKGNEILNEGGLRYNNEFARHKVLDAIGDLALAGMPIRGHFTGHCCGHALNNRLLHALFADKSAWRIVETGAAGDARAAV
ncbi:MAG: UDP-3-O-acyl-N-acetylglucosamine deacetylase [Alphaproteobacteria bacterium]|nr:UDP-3-O-acyl-N-acetylglucosamine deacetylase [Alphaproteobacteria bacterium]